MHKVEEEEEEEIPECGFHKTFETAKTTLSYCSLASNN
jgi:hypothetical protein